MLRRINLLYLAIPFLCWGLYEGVRHLNKNVATFYGFAENKETGINMEHPVVVQKIWIKPGQFVTKGTLLMEVNRIALDFKMNDLSSDIAQLESNDVWRMADIRSKIEQIKAEKQEKTASIQANIRQAEAEMALRQRLINDLKTVQIDSINPNNSPYQAKINAFREELRFSATPYDKGIIALEQELKLAGIPKKNEIGRLKNEVNLYKKEQERLFIFAPSDGLIGNIHCKEGENISSFTTLISFYEENPNMVIGYLHESLKLQVKIGDSLLVTSSLHPSEMAVGRISGLGHRIIEIPERLRKIPELRTYGREILIEIPTTNHFLQKEKVLLQWHDSSTDSIPSVLSQKK